MGSAVRSLARRLRPLRSAPQLSVVVPVYNVEEYVAPCLESVLGQEGVDLEVVVVDDGATDASMDVVEEFARRNRRIRVVRQQNQGLGAARNAGVAVARGRFLTFLDSDDTLPPGAYRLLSETIERTGSDLAVGALREDHGHRRTVGRLMEQNHRVRRESTTLTETPLILADVFAQNKVYRRSFWERAGLSFPVGVRYEDQPTLTRAFLAADRIDVLPETVYLRRVRQDGSSITQTRHLVRDLEDRILTKRSSTEALLAARPDLSDLWFGTVLPVDMWEYFRAAAGADDAYWSLLRGLLAEHWNERTLPFTRTEVPVQQRLMGWLVEQDRRADLVALLRHLDAVRRDPAVEIRGSEVVCLLPGVDDPSYGAPDSAYVLRDSELVWQARLLTARWHADRLEIDGFALVRNLPTGGRRTSVRAHAVGPRGVEVELDVRPTKEPRATRAVGRRSQDYDDCGFSLGLDPAVLAGLAPGDAGGRGRWHLRFRREVDGIVRTGSPTGYRAAKVDLGPRQVAPGLVAGLVDVDGELVVEVEAVAADPVTAGSQEARG